MEKYEERQEAQRLADLEEAQQMLGEQLEQDTLTAEDITDLRLVDSEYMSGTRTKSTILIAKLREKRIDFNTH